MSGCKELLFGSLHAFPNQARLVQKESRSQAREKRRERASLLGQAPRMQARLQARGRADAETSVRSPLPSHLLPSLLVVNGALATAASSFFSAGRGCKFSPLNRLPTSSPPTNPTAFYPPTSVHSFSPLLVRSKWPRARNHQRNRICELFSR